MQLLYQHDLCAISPEEMLDVFWTAYPSGSENRIFAEFLFHGFLSNRSQVDDLIRRNAKHWRLDRMAVVDRNILRMAISELLMAETPQAVVIDEAIEIARRFSTEESSQFVNGLLDAIRKELEPRVMEETNDEG